MLTVQGLCIFIITLQILFSLRSCFHTKIKRQDQAAPQPSAQLFMFLVRSGDSEQLPWHGFPEARGDVVSDIQHAR